MYVQGQNQSTLFKYPITPNTSEWREYKTTADRLKALQIPEGLLSLISTEELIDVCLDFPYIGEFLCFNDYQYGFEKVTNKFNGYKELMNRKDLVKVLPSKASEIHKLIDTSSDRKSTINSQIKLIAFDFLIIQEDILNQFDKNTRNQLQDEIRKTAQLNLNSTIIQGYEYLINCIEKKGHKYSSSYSSCNQSVTITTPNGTVIPDTYVYTCTDMNDSEKLYWWNYWHGLYPNTTKMGDASYKYNCHGYAWHMYPNNQNPVWLGYYSEGETYHYWTDGSYISVPEAIATHIDYEGDHSAIRLNSNEYVSKWNCYPLFKHAPNESPYGQPAGYYRIAPKISGSDYVCLGTYSIINMPPNSTIQWSVNNSNIAIVSGQGTTTVSVQKQSNGSATLTATIKYNGVTIATPTKNVITTNPVLGMSIQFQTPTGINGCWASNMINNTFTIENDHSFAYDIVEARLYRLDNNNNPSQLVESWSNISTTNAHIDGYTQGWYLFQLRGVNDCGYSDWLEQEVEMVDFSILNFLLDYDASTEILTLTLIEPNNENAQNKTINSQSKLIDSYIIELWNGLNSIKVDSYRTDLIKYQISLVGMPSGIYIVRIIKDGKSYSKKFTKR